MLNQVIEMGRLTADPELKQTQSGVSFINFSIAVDRNYVNENNVRETDFFDVVAWRGTAEFIARNFTKGRMIAVVGSLENQRWEDSAGNKRTSTRIKAEQALFCGDRRDTQTQPAAEQPSYAAPSRPAQQEKPAQMQMPYNPYSAQTPLPQRDDDLPF